MEENAPAPGSEATGGTNDRRGRGQGAVGRRDQGPTPRQLGEAAARCYRDTDSDEEIARQLGIARCTPARWKRRPEFVAAIIALRTNQRLDWEQE